MSDPAKVRLVRCPKCEKVLPELEGYSVYQCGGCGAVLRANTRDFEMDPLSQKSDEAVEENLYGKPENSVFSENQKSFTEGSDNDVRSKGRSSGTDDKQDEKSKAKKCVVDYDLERNETSHGFLRAEMGGNFRKFGPSNGSAIGSHQSESFGDGREVKGVWENKNQNFQTLGYSTSIYSEVDPSRYASRPSYGHEERKDKWNGADELRKVEYLEHDRAELLRKLDELKDQVSQSCNINDKSKEKASLDPRIIQGVNYVNKPSYTTHCNETSSYIGQHETSKHTYYDPLSSQMLRRASHQEPNPYFSGHYIHEKIDPYIQPYPNDMNLHHPHCTCVHCYNNHSRVPPSYPPTTFQNRTLPHEPYNAMLYQHGNKSSCVPSDYNSYARNFHPLGPQSSQPHTRGPNNLNFDVRGCDSRRPPRVGMTSRKRCCHPRAGGAPVVLCYKCFQLLELPKKCSSTMTNLVKMKCGACSTLVVFAVVDKKLIPASVDANMILNMVVKNPDLALRGNNLHTHVRVNQTSTNFSSEDYDDSSYDFQFLDRGGQDFGLHNFKNTRGIHSESSCSSEHEVSLDSINPQEESPSSADLEDHFDYLSKYRFEKGDQSEFSDREKAELIKVTSRQNSMNDASSASEMDMSFNEDINAEVSLESGDTSKDEHQLRGNKRAQSFFRGIIKKGFKDLSKSNTTVEQTSTGVMINGHPMTERLLRKAEKKAGPVHPGQYWYDYRGGFWGVMGGPCLGIIPPFIEEFNYLIPENCAGGNTDVFVNGRELHQKDLNLLSSRGLPSTGDRSYIIEISGRVLDEDTGEELPSLGKLAPTVEKVKHGFGMKVPRIAT